MLVHHEKYRPLSDAEIVEKHADREKNAWDRYNAIPELKKRLAEAGITKVTDFYTSEFKYSKEMHTEVSTMLLAKLKEQGFWL